MSGKCLGLAFGGEPESIPIANKPLYLEEGPLLLLEEQEVRVELLCSPEPTPFLTRRYFPDFAMKLAWEAIAEEHVAQSGKNSKLRGALCALRLMGVDYKDSIKWS